MNAARVTLRHSFETDWVFSHPSRQPLAPVPTEPSLDSQCLPHLIRSPRISEIGTPSIRAPETPDPAGPRSRWTPIPLDPYPGDPTPAGCRSRRIRHAAPIPLDPRTCRSRWISAHADPAGLATPNRSRWIPAHADPAGFPHRPTLATPAGYATPRLLVEPPQTNRSAPPVPSRTSVPAFMDVASSITLDHAP